MKIAPPTPDEPEETRPMRDDSPVWTEADLQVLRALENTGNASPRQRGYAFERWIAAAGFTEPSMFLRTKGYMTQRKKVA